MLRAGDFMPGFFSRLLWGCMISEFDRGPRGLCRRGGRPKLGSPNSGHLAKVQVVAEVRERDRVLCDKAATLGVLASLRLCRRPSYSDGNSIRAVYQELAGHRGNGLLRASDQFNGAPDFARHGSSATNRATLTSSPQASPAGFVATESANLRRPLPERQSAQPKPP